MSFVVAELHNPQSLFLRLGDLSQLAQTKAMATAQRLLTSEAAIQAVCRFTAPGSEAFNDMQIMLLQTLPQPALRLRSLLVKPLSSGRLRLNSKNPYEAPDIQLNLLSDPEDARRMREGLRMLGDLIQLPSLVDLGASTAWQK